MSSMNCMVCAASIPMHFQSSLCPACFGRLPGTTPGQPRRADGHPWAGSVRLCLMLGSVVLGLGMMCLIDPRVDPNARITFQHALAMGQAFTIAGVILIGFGIRPR